ncbi:hypothetical protein Hanom_Chr10g00889421 [Helianthus anomalus]
MPFPFWKPINRAVIVFISTFGKTLTDQPLFFIFSPISLNPDLGVFG